MSAVLITTKGFKTVVEILKVC